MDNLHFNEMIDGDVHFLLDQPAQLNFYSASSLKQQSTGRKLAPLGHYLDSRGVTIHFFHKRYVSRYLICITIRCIGNCNYSLKSMLVDMGAAMFFLYEVAHVLAEIINIWYLIN